MFELKAKDNLFTDGLSLGWPVFVKTYLYYICIRYTF